MNGEGRGRPRREGGGRPRGGNESPDRCPRRPPGSLAAVSRAARRLGSGEWLGVPRALPGRVGAAARGRGRPRAGPGRRGGGPGRQRPVFLEVASSAGRGDLPACAPRSERAAGAVVYGPRLHFTPRAGGGRGSAGGRGAPGRPLLRPRLPGSRVPALPLEPRPARAVTHQHRARGRPPLRIALPPAPTALRSRRGPRAACLGSARPGGLSRVECRLEWPRSWLEQN